MLIRKQEASSLGVPVVIEEYCDGSGLLTIEGATIDLIEVTGVFSHLVQYRTDAGWHELPIDDDV